jgi:hypothetical protein
MLHLPSRIFQLLCLKRFLNAKAFRKFQQLRTGNGLRGAEVRGETSLLDG